MPGAPSSVLAPSSKARSYVRSFLFQICLWSEPVQMDFATVQRMGRHPPLNLIRM